VHIDKEVSEDEVDNVESLVTHMRRCQATFVRQDSDIREEDLCQICCANKKCTVFKPCGHHSCR